MTKRHADGSNWRISDVDRSDIRGFNPHDQKLYTDGAWVEGSGDPIQFFSNGIKIWDGDHGFNASNDFYYWAFAENPFKTARAR